MAEYGSMFAVSGIATLLFLGGWHTGFLWFELSDGLYDVSGGQTWLWIVGNVINVLVFIVKGWFLVFVMMWVRWTLPRLRIDQVMMLCLKYLIPISCMLLAGVSAWMLFIPVYIQQYIGWGIFGLCVLGTGWLVFQMVTLAKQ